MADQVDSFDRVEKQIEGRFKYQTDMTKYEHSPNLRKHYQDSVKKRSNSQDRRSPYIPSNQRLSPFRNSPQERRQSPPCSTFNPRRQHTLEEFSPYDERTDLEEKLNRELLEENASLRNQLVQCGQSIDSLKLELAKRDGQLIKLRENSQADLRYFENVVAEMTNQIQIVLTKNKILENQLIVTKGRLQQEMRRYEGQLKYEQQRRKLEEQRRSVQSRREEEPRRNTPQPMNSRRSVGKLMSRPVANNQLNQTMKPSRIKIEEDSQLVSQSNIENSKVGQNKSVGVEFEKQSKKGEELISSIKSMQLKITGDQSTSLKELWKWLKGIGHTHSCLKRWKGKATQASSYYSQQRLRELIREACSYLQ